MRPPTLENILSRPLPRFVLLLVLLTPIALAGWWWIALDLLINPFISSVRWVPGMVFSENIVTLRSIQAQWGSWEAVTSLSPQNDPLSLVSFVVPVQRLSLGLPIFWALQLATPGARRWRQLLAGTGVLLMVLVVLILLYIQSTLVVYADPGGGVTGGIPVLITPYSGPIEKLSRLAGRLTEITFPLLTPVLLWALLNSTALSHWLRQPRLAQTPLKTKGRARK